MTKNARLQNEVIEAKMLGVHVGEPALGHMRCSACGTDGPVVEIGFGQNTIAVSSLCERCADLAARLLSLKALRKKVRR